jgi:uncharacterized protein YndB with AHSA1/START domain
MVATELELVETVTVTAPAARVLSAFVDPHDLAVWWQVARSVTVPRPLGTYAVEWPATTYRDDLLGPLGGAFHGTVLEFQAGRELFVADAFWNPPEGDPIGPMALEVRCAADGSTRTRSSVRLSGLDEGPRWQRYFQVMAAGWPRALAELKRYLEMEAFGA